MRQLSRNDALFLASESVHSNSNVSLVQIYDPSTAPGGKFQGATILAAMCPPDHPYSWPTIGSMADITVASRADVADFFRRYYHPANASLAIAGDFDPKVAKRLVEQYFGPIPAGPKVEKLKRWTPELKEDKRVAMTDRVGLARVYLNWALLS